MVSKIKINEQRNLLNSKKKTRRKLSIAEMNAERMALRAKTIEMYERGYVSDFVYQVGKKHNWFKVNEVENEVIL
jgi:hypothetical protein